MNIACWASSLPRRSLSVRMTVLAAVMLAAYGVVVCPAMSKAGASGVAAVSLAAGVWLMSAAVALLFTHLLYGPASGVVGIMLAMLVRMGLPVSLALIVRIRGQGLVEAGLVYYLVGFYLLALLVETPMSLPQTTQSRHAAEASGRGSWKVHG